jgi:hypothetical protein
MRRTSAHTPPAKHWSSDARRFADSAPPDGHHRSPATIPATQRLPCSAPNSTEETSSANQLKRVKATDSKSGGTRRLRRNPRNASSSTIETAIVAASAQNVIHVLCASVEAAAGAGG